MAFQFIAAAAAVVGAATGIYGAKQAADARSDQKAAINRATNEKVRRIQKEKDAFAGSLGAQVGGSGVDIDSRSTLEVMNDSLTEYQYDIAVTREAGADAASYAALQGKQAVWGGLTSAAKSVGDLSAIGIDAGWWGKGSTVPLASTATSTTTKIPVSGVANS